MMDVREASLHPFSAHSAPLRFILVAGTSHRQRGPAVDVGYHGGGSGSDWTLGCIALDDADLDALRALLPADRRSWIYVRP
jgi:hypothetical protein